MSRLATIDAQLEAEVGPLRSLDPSGRRATSLAALHRALAPGLDADRAVALADGLARTARAIRDHFPGNLFWDLDAMAAALVRRCRSAPALRQAFDTVVELHALYGGRGPIRFRYIHDFVYGFDWAKWVRRDPPARAAVGPYSEAFFDATLARGHELLALIEADDPKYPRLRGEGARNPFRFSREPEAEARLHRRLAAEGLIPVRAWLLDPRPVWDRPYAELRAERARSCVAEEERHGPREL